MHLMAVKLARKYLFDIKRSLKDLHITILGKCEWMHKIAIKLARKYLFDIIITLVDCFL